ncbi:low quality protein: uncharacterized protein k02a2.6-like [Plakobranchus ocellatus]|uniref:Low quality protein: uncharacterized protein k02a2.6-like n=1 Tax=Plakobranchus ocellatus TaxID=259542 RepID=A0AAV3YD32_9GAST|nr:low quality protein: uncharacterized protein k02a2.6-like [Plakobranchus ocellatus]
MKPSDKTAVASSDIAAHTKKDPVLSQALRLSTKVYPSVNQSVRHQLMRQKHYHDHSAKERLIEPNQRVFYRNHPGVPKWVPGTAIAKTAQVAFKVKSEQHGIIRRDQNCLVAAKRHYRPSPGFRALDH